MINNNKKIGMTLMELLVVIVIVGILITFGMVAISLMSRDYEQRKLPQGIYKNLKEITAEILVRNPQEKRDGFNDQFGEDIEESFIPGEKKLPAFGGAGNGSFCDAFRQIVNPSRNRFNCNQSINVNGRAQRGGGDIGNEMYIIGLSNQPVTCWDGRRCIRVYVSIKQDSEDEPMFEEAGTINREGNMYDVVDHFGFNIYENGDVEPMIERVSADGSDITPYGVAADMVNVDVVVDSVDEIYRDRLNLLTQVINNAVLNCGANCGDVQNPMRGDEALQLHNRERLNYFVTTNNGKETRDVASTAANFVNPVITRTGDGEFCEYGMACRVGFEDNDVAIELDENGQPQARAIAVPDYRQRQMNDANVLFFKIPYRRALAIKNRIEEFSFRTNQGFIMRRLDICARQLQGLDVFESRRCIERRFSKLNPEDRDFIQNSILFNMEILGPANYCSLGDLLDLTGNARRRRICRLVNVSLR